MKSTGIIRRIDELGRIVIPKEIRRTLRLREGDPMELFVDQDGVVFKKYSPLGEFKGIAEEFVDVLYKKIYSTTLICDKDIIIAASNLKNSYLEAPISKELSDSLDSRSTKIYTSGISIIDNGQDNTKSCLVVPIIAEGNPVGGIIVFKDEINDVDKMAVEVVCAYIAKQLES